MKFTAILMAIAAVQAVRFDTETESSLSKLNKQNKWFEDEIHDDEYSEKDITNLVHDVKNIQLSYSGANEARMTQNALGLTQGFEDEIDENVQLSASNNNRNMVNIAKKYGTI